MLSLRNNTVTIMIIIIIRRRARVDARSNNFNNNYRGPRFLTTKINICAYTDETICASYMGERNPRIVLNRLKRYEIIYSVGSLRRRCANLLHASAISSIKRAKISSCRRDARMSFAPTASVLLYN